MNIILNVNNDSPIYEQIEEQIKKAILSGKLKPKTPLPSIRALANDLKVSVITTKKAYEILQGEDLIYTVSQKGSFVSELDKEKIRLTIKKEIQKKLSETILCGKEYGLTNDELNILFKENLYDRNK